MVYRVILGQRYTYNLSLNVKSKKGSRNSNQEGQGWKIHRIFMLYAIMLCLNCLSHDK